MTCKCAECSVIFYFICKTVNPKVKPRGPQTSGQRTTSLFIQSSSLSLIKEHRENHIDWHFLILFPLGVEDLGHTSCA